MKKFILISLALTSLFINKTYSQPDVFAANNEFNQPYSYPWAGGINAAQFGEIDMNIDGVKDLLVFDRRGNRIMCFLNNGIPDKVDYEFAPEYTDVFPEFSDWVIFADYDVDGRNDIFTYSPGYAGIIVYHNVSVNTLKFERVVYPYLKTHLPGGYVNLYVTNADYPGIADVDFDGDLDILTFGVLGSFIDWHKNLSMEKYGIPDSLDFEHTTYCWGHVAESDESNEIFLDTCFGSKHHSKIINTERHVGSTFMVHDIDNNGLVDVLLGDVDYPQLVALYNNSSIEDAIVTEYDLDFPASESVNLYSMPCAFYIDVDNNGIKDLLVSPFDPGPTTSRSTYSSWYYKNNGSNSLPDLELIQDDFLQDNMIDVGTAAYPVLFDWDGDGLQDLIVGNYGRYMYSYYENYFLKTVYYSGLAYFKNVGQEGDPVFQLWDKNLEDILQYELVGVIPAFADINDDGLTDMLLGNSTGTLVYMENNGNGLDLITNNFQQIDVGDFSAPQLFDYDLDGDEDLIIGEKAGNINYYENTGNYNFEFVTDSLGKVNVTDYSISYDGYSVPYFFRKDNLTHMVSGSEQGKVFYFTGIDGNLWGKYIESDQLDVLLDTSSVNYDRGMRTAALVFNLTDNDKLEMIVGNYSGGLEYFNGNVQVNSGVNENEVNNFLIAYPNPAKDVVKIDITDEKLLSVALYNTKGTMLSPEYVYNNKHIEINIAPFANGFYVLKLITSDGIKYSKFVINR